MAIAPQNDLFDTMGRGTGRMAFLSLILNLTGGTKWVNILKYWTIRGIEMTTNVSLEERVAAVKVAIIEYLIKRL